jgi:UDP-glucose 4-epimerase
MLNHLHATPRKPDRVVVVGSNGFVGRTITARLRAEGADVLGLSRAEVDLLAPGADAKLQGALRPTDTVVFVSAIAPAKTVEQMMLNLDMARAACRAFAAAPPAHLVYISSDAIYADDANPVREDSPAAPTTTHGMMHAARELMFRTTMPGRFAALRPTLIYGANDPHNGYGPNRFRRQGMKGEPIGYFGEGEERRDHIDVADVARLAALIVFRRSVGALNAVTGVSTSFREVAEIVARQFDPPVRSFSIPRPGPRPHLLHRFFDITACHKAFPEFRFTPLAEGLEKAHKEQQGS